MEQKDDFKDKDLEFEHLPMQSFLYANPLILLGNMQGGKRSEAAEWFQEVTRMLFGIEKSISDLDNIVPLLGKEVKIKDTVINISEEEKQWHMVYLIDNSILRLFAALDKVSQMVRVYYEHKDNGGLLMLIPRCNCPEKGILKEENCTMGTLMQYLYKYPRNSLVDDELKKLNNNKFLNELKPYRNGFVHRRSSISEDLGLSAKVSSEYEEGGAVHTSYSFDVKSLPLHYIRKDIIKSHNAIVGFLVAVEDVIFPKDFQIKVTSKDKENE